MASLISHLYALQTFQFHGQPSQLQQLANSRQPGYSWRTIVTGGHLILVYCIMFYQHATIDETTIRRWALSIVPSFDVTLRCARPVYGANRISLVFHPAWGLSREIRKSENRWSYLSASFQLWECVAALKHSSSQIGISISGKLKRKEVII